MGYKITAGAEYFYAGYGTSNGMNHGCCRMKDPVDGECLRKAVETAMQRYPYFRVKAVLKNDEYVIEPNDAPIVIYEGDKPLPIGSPEMNNYLVGYGYNGKILFCDFFLGIAGGRGAMRLNQSVLYYYCKYRYNLGNDIYCPGVRTIETKPASCEICDPYRHCEMPEMPVELLSAPDAFVLPEERVAIGEPQTMYTLSVSADSYISFTKANAASPAVMTALFMCHAIDEVHPKREKPIAIFMPVDAGSALGCSDTAQNSLADLHLVYTDRLKSWTLDRQANYFRRMVAHQTTPEVLRKTFARRKSLFARVMKETGLESKRNVYMTWAPRYVLPSVSYPGRMDFGDIDKYRGAFMNCCDASVKGMVVEAFPAGDRITICIAYGIKDDCYYKALKHQLALAGIEYTEDKPYKYVPIERKF